MFELDEPPKYFCHHCAKPVKAQTKPGRRDECTACGAELHVCLNCSLYDERMVRGCREPQAEEVRDRERANFCGWFTYRVGPPATASKSAEDKARAAFESLFRK